MKKIKLSITMSQDVYDALVNYIKTTYLPYNKSLAIERILKLFLMRGENNANK